MTTKALEEIKICKKKKINVTLIKAGARLATGQIRRQFTHCAIHCAETPLA